MRWWHVTLTAALSSLLIVLSLSVYLNSLFINGKIRMEQPSEVSEMLDNYSKTKKQ